MERIQNASNREEILRAIQSISGETDEYGLTHETTDVDIADLYVATVESMTKDDNGYYPQDRDIAMEFAKMAYEADTLLVQATPHIPKADYIDSSRIKDLMKHVNIINKQHLSMLEETRDV